jgi:hypothetical protein
MSTTAEEYMDGYEIQDDWGVMRLIGDQAMAIADSHKPTEEPRLADLIPFPITRAEQAVLDFNRHPVFDTAATAVALTGLGFIAGAVVGHHRRD